MASETVHSLHNAPKFQNSESEEDIWTSILDIDSHSLSELAQETAIEVLATKGVEIIPPPFMISFHSG